LPGGYRATNYVRMRGKILTPVMNQSEKDKLTLQNLDSCSEKQLITESLKGNKHAMEALYELYKRPLFNLLYRHTYDYETSEDLLQEVFIKIFTNLCRLEDESMFQPWAFRIALNTYYSYLREKREERKMVSFDEVESSLPEEEKFTCEELKKPLDEAIENLPSKLKSVFLLHDVQGFKHEEIAEIFGWKTGTSKSQLFKARMKIRNFLEKKRFLRR